MTVHFCFDGIALEATRAALMLRSQDTHRSGQLCCAVAGRVERQMQKPASIASGDKESNSFSDKENFPNNLI